MTDADSLAQSVSRRRQDLHHASARRRRAARRARRVASRSAPGECVVLGGPSGAGKSSILKMVYGNYRCDDGHASWSATATSWSTSPARRAAPRARAAPPTHRLCQPVPAGRSRASRRSTSSPQAARRAAARAAATRRARPRRCWRGSTCRERLWRLPPATFSGGEQQRVNIARGFVAEHPHPAARRADRLARRRKPRRRGRADRRQEARRRRHARHLPRRRRARGASPTASSTSPALPLQPERPMMDRADYVISERQPRAAATGSSRGLGGGQRRTASPRSARARRRRRASTWRRDTLIPGLVELHTDHLEQHYTPRPGSELAGAGGRARL